MPHRASKPKAPTRSPLRSEIQQAAAGFDGMVEPRHALDRLQHEVAGVEASTTGLFALGAELARQQHCDAWPSASIHEAVVEAGRILAQGLELGALALRRCTLAPKIESWAKKLQRRALDAAGCRG